jgi:hypothetical protein
MAHIAITGFADPKQALTFAQEVGIPLRLLTEPCDGYIPVSIPIGKNTLVEVDERYRSLRITNEA